MDAPEGKILFATIACIEKYGLENTTIRRIGKEAQMNSASISYYFRSKESLMERAMEVALDNAFDMGNFQESAKLPARERLIAVLDGMLAGAQQYPGISKAFFLELLLGNKHESPMTRRCNLFLDILKRELEAAYPQKTSAEIAMAVMAAASATFLFPGLFPGFFTLAPLPALTDEGQRKSYVRYVVTSYFKEEAA